MIARTGFYPTFVAFYTLVLREIRRFMRLWSQTLIPPVVTMTLYFIIFGKLIGSQIRSINGYSYIQFIVPGLVMMSVITNAYANTVSSFFLTKFNKSIEEMVVSPMPSWVILIGFMLGGVVRGMMVGGLVLIVAFLFTHMPIKHPLIVFAMVTLSAMVFSLAGLINGIYAKRFDDISFIPTFVLTPLTYLGGVFYSINQLPPFWRGLSRFNPVFDMVSTFRYGILGVSDVNVYFGFGLVVFFLVSMFAIAWYLLAKGIGVKA